LIPLRIQQSLITVQDITKASAAAYRVAKFNFTHADEMDQLEEAFSSNGTVSPFEQGAGWVGTWTLPVCDMGTNNWNTQYGAKPTRFGRMPCCCGKLAISFPFFISQIQIHIHTNNWFRPKLLRNKTIHRSSEYAGLPDCSSCVSGSTQTDEYQL
jgi:hypothetical protein